MTFLRQRMLEDMQVRNLSPHTERAIGSSVSAASALVLSLVLPGEPAAATAR